MQASRLVCLGNARNCVLVSSQRQGAVSLIGRCKGTGASCSGQEPSLEGLCLKSEQLGAAGSLTSGMETDIHQTGPFAGQQAW